MPVRSPLMILILLTLSIYGGATNAAELEDRHVVLISVDGFPADLLNDPSIPIPTIRRLALQGATAEGMIVSNPSVTWPNHTSLVTGVRPDQHGVLFNGKLQRGGIGLPVSVDPHKDKADLVHVPTLYDVLHPAGAATAAVNWPCTRNAATLDDDFPDVPETFKFTTPRFLESLQQAGVLTEERIQNFMRLSPAARDHIWTQAVCHVIRTRRPQLTLFHLLNVDATHHRYGPQTWAGAAALAYADACVREVLAAVEEAGLTDRTTILIVSDHGFLAIPKTLQPNVLLRQAGLLTVEGRRIATARVQVIPEGGIGMVYLTVPDTREADRQAVIELFEDQEGIADIVTPDEFSRYGLPLPRDYPQMADLILVAKDGYGFSGSATGKAFIVPSQSTVGTHGFLSTNPKMNAVFVAAGAAIRPGVKLGVIENIDVAPTIARLLGIEFPSVQGQVLEEILKPETKAAPQN